MASEVLERIPLTRNDKRLDRRKINDSEEFKNYVNRVYECGSEDENFPGSELPDGGQEQPLSRQSAMDFGRQLLRLIECSSLSHQKKIRIKWVNTFALDIQ